LIKFNSSIQKFRAIPNVFNPSDNPEFEILSMKEDKKGDLWLGTWRKGLLWFNKQNGIIGSFMNKSANPFCISYQINF
jgi:ligand-binding sensor domain-containing protein